MPSHVLSAAVFGAESYSLGLVIGALLATAVAVVFVATYALQSSSSSSAAGGAGAPEAARFLQEAAESREWKRGELPFYLNGKNYASGLKPFSAARPWLHRSPSRARRELQLKQTLLSGPHRGELYSAVADGGSVEAQRECLRLVVEHSLAEAPPAVRVAELDWAKGTGEITLLSTNSTFKLAEYWPQTALILASLLVQEDLILLQPGGINAKATAALADKTHSVVSHSEHVLLRVLLLLLLLTRTHPRPQVSPPRAPASPSRSWGSTASSAT